MGTARLPLAIACFAAAPLSCAALAGGCGGTAPSAADSGHDHAPPVGYDAGPRLDAAFHPEASCLVTIDTPPLGPEIHVDEGSAIDFTSNPPAGGPHYPVWARFSTYFAEYAENPVPRGYYVHDMEHGAVVLLYKCPGGAPEGGLSPDGGSCAEKAEAFLWQVANAIPADPLCMPPIRVRVVVTPDPLIPTPIAAAAWGWTYTAECQDLPTLAAFAKAHYATAPENFCNDGYWPP